MEKYRFLWSLLLVGLSSILFSCSDDDEVTGPLTIKTGLLKEIGYTTAVCGGEISGGSGIGNRGVCWSTDVQPTVKDKHTTDGSGRGEFRSEITGLTEGVQYYVRAWVETSDGVKYGEEKTCVTLAHGRPTMLLMGINNIKETSAEVQAQVFTDGGVDITERGVVYRLQSAGTDEPALENATKLKVEGKTGLLEGILNGFTDNETYICRAYVVYAEGTIYTKSETFTTEKYTAPKAEIEEVKDITNTAFTVTVNIASGTPLPVLEYGVVWGIKSGPTIENNKLKLGEGDGQTSTTVGELQEGSVYYVRPYAVNKNGITYGEEEVVATLSYKAAITTRMTAYVTAHRAYVGGEILNTGVLNAAVTEAGVCWGMAEHPTIADNKLKAEGIGNDHTEFDSLMLFPLKPETKYYVRTYVINEYGTNYGDEYSFTTREPVADFFKAEGSSGDNPVFNGLNLTSTYPGGIASGDQQDAYERLSNILTTYGKRVLTAYRIYLVPDKSQQPRYIYTTIQYQNSAGNAYVGIWRDKIDWDADYVYTVSHHQSNGNNATNIYNSAVKNGQEEDLLRSVDYLSQSPFVIDWDNENSTTINSAFYIIPIKYPDKFKRMGVFRYTSLTPAEDWW